MTSHTYLRVDLDAIRERAAAATEGPWTETYPGSRVIEGAGGDIVVDSFNDGVGAGVVHPADAAFIAHARTDVPALVNRVTELTHLLGSHADGHLCTCEQTDPGQYGIRPPTWEQDPWCLTHPAMSVIVAEHEAVTAERDAYRDRLRGLTSRLGFGDDVTEPMADNDTIVKWLEERESESADWRDSQRWRDDCYAAGHPDDQDCHEHDPTLRLAASDELLLRLRALVVDIRTEYAASDYTEHASLGDIAKRLDAVITPPSTDGAPT